MAKAKLRDDDFSRAEPLPGDEGEEQVGEVTTVTSVSADGDSTTVTRRRRTPEEFLAIYGYRQEDETPSQKFTRVGQNRVSGIINGLRTLPALANKKQYEYTDDRADKMFAVIEEEFKNAKSEFERIRTGGVSSAKSFSF
jgi:hypothetical protein